MDDLGGEDAEGAQQMALIEAAVRTRRLYVDHVDAWIIEARLLDQPPAAEVPPCGPRAPTTWRQPGRTLNVLGLERRLPG
jgi:hypothetical protein